MPSRYRVASRLAQGGALALVAVAAVAVWAAQPAKDKPAGGASAPPESAAPSAAPSPEQARSAPTTLACAIPNPPLDQALRALPDHPLVTHATSRDADSQEPIERDVVVYAGGTRLVVEQQNCAIYNLRLSLDLPKAEPSEAHVARFAAVLAATPVWREKFAAIDAGAMIRKELASPAWRAGRAAGAPFSYATDALPVTGETSETLVAYAPGQGGGALTLTIAVGD